MNLLNLFPEIHSFFSKNKFEQYELDSLCLKLQEKYPDFETHKAAIALVKLELLKFYLEDFNKVEEVSGPTRNGKILAPSTPKDNAPSISKLAITLGISSQYLLRLLKQKGIQKTADDKLSIDEEEKMRLFFKTKGKSDRRKEKRKNFLESMKFRKIESIIPSEECNGVYDKVSLYGQGKLIYIRMK